MTNTIGPLTAADEGFCHQVVDTFASVGTSDLSWTEKVCAMAAARDGSVQLGFGLGKYTNRNVMDAYAGTSRGVEQITVRASRALGIRSDHDRDGTHPLRGRGAPPIVRFVLEPNDVQPIAFDWLFEGTFPPAFEDRTHIRTQHRVSADIVRFHQIGLCSGWLEIDGERIEITPESWVSTRDHSWGVRYGIGQPQSGVEPPAALGELPLLLDAELPRTPRRRARTGLHGENHTRRPGEDHTRAWGTIEHPDGTIEQMADIVPELATTRSNRRLRGGACTARWTTVRPGRSRSRSSRRPGSTSAPASTSASTGTTTASGAATCTSTASASTTAPTPENARRVHQIRDTVVRITDPVGGGVGWGNWQPIVTGEHPELGLTADTSFM